MWTLKFSKSLKSLDIARLLMEFKEILCTFTWHTNCYEDCSKRTKNEEDIRFKNSV